MGNDNIRQKLFFNEDAVRRMLIKVSPKSNMDILLLSREALESYYNFSILSDVNKTTLYEIHYTHILKTLN
jgi:hypothetical protein